MTFRDWLNKQTVDRCDRVKNGSWYRKINIKGLVKSDNLQQFPVIVSKDSIYGIGVKCDLKHELKDIIKEDPSDSDIDMFIVPDDSTIEILSKETKDLYTIRNSEKLFYEALSSSNALYYNNANKCIDGFMFYGELAKSKELRQKYKDTEDTYLEMCFFNTKEIKNESASIFLAKYMNALDLRFFDIYVTLYEYNNNILTDIATVKINITEKRSIYNIVKITKSNDRITVNLTE